MDEEQLESKWFSEEIAQWQVKVEESEQERKNWLAELSKNDDLDEFQTWLNEKEERKKNLPDWDKVINEVKQKVRDYHLVQKCWSSGWLKGNKEYWQVFQSRLEED